MATRKTAVAKPAPNKKPGKAMVNWEAELAAQADIAVATEANVGAGGNYFSLKGGQLSFNDAPVPGNEMTVVILDHIIENVYYLDSYDPDDKQPPAAYALGRDEETIRWHEDSIEEYAGELCKDSDINQFGSADKGKGKACKNKRRLALIAEGDLQDVANAEPAFLKIPTTSVKGWASYVKQLAETLKRPPLGVITRIKVVPDPKTQFKVQFTLEESISDGDVIGALMEKKATVQTALFAEFAKAEEAPPTPARRGKAGPVRNSKATGKAATKAPLKGRR
jgi:hypothetical protein